MEAGLLTRFFHNFPEKSDLSTEAACGQTIVNSMVCEGSHLFHERGYFDILERLWALFWELFETIGRHFLYFLESMEGVKIERKKSSPKRRPKGPPVCAGG